MSAATNDAIASALDRRAGAGGDAAQGEGLCGGGGGWFDRYL